MTAVPDDLPMVFQRVVNNITPSPLLKIPATHPVINVANVAAKSARKPKLARSSRREGASIAVPPTKIATAATCANPQSA